MTTLEKAAPGALPEGWTAETRARIENEIAARFLPESAVKTFDLRS
jgi:hypothetical protein